MNKYVIRVWIPNILEGSVLDENLASIKFDSKEEAGEELVKFSKIYGVLESIWVLTEDGFTHVPSSVITNNASTFYILEDEQ